MIENEGHYKEVLETQERRGTMNNTKRRNIHENLEPPTLMVIDPT